MLRVPVLKDIFLHELVEIPSNSCLSVSPLYVIAIVIFSFVLRLLVFMLVATVAVGLRLQACFAHEEG